MSEFNISRIANLARLDLTEEEVTMFGPQLENIIAYVQAISNIDTEGSKCKPYTKVTRSLKDFRPDVISKSLDVVEVLNNGPVVFNGEIQMPRILS